ncbi:MAG: hypothetical protein BWX50_01140 [Euryarchaeota archaeon ADurb.Bin009]|nr:MAG: hypothetical protein BWX50_01140 [Euryarchaeota archaeon ADurb.Bin009]
MPELDIPHLSAPADHARDKDALVAPEKPLHRILHVPAVCGIGVGTLEPGLQGREIPREVPGDPGKRRVQVPASPFTIYQNKTIRQFAEDREADALSRVQRLAGLPCAVGIRSSPAGARTRIVSRHGNQPSPAHPYIRAGKRSLQRDLPVTLDKFIVVPFPFIVAIRFFLRVSRDYRSAAPKAAQASPIFRASMQYWSTLAKKADRARFVRSSSPSTKSRRMYSSAIT